MQAHTRRTFFTISATAIGTACLSPKASGQSTGLKPLSKNVFVPSKNDTGVFPGFVTYTHATKPILLNRYGWVNASDTYDDFHETVSTNNGLFWSKAKLKVKSKEVDGGLMKYIEHSAFFDPDTNKLFSFVGKSFYPNGNFDANQPRHVEITERNPETLRDLSSTQHEFGQRGGMGISFCFPIKTKSGRIIVPGFSARVNEQNEFVHHPVSKLNIYDAFMLLGDYQPNGDINWTLSEALQADDEKSTRGVSECGICQLKDGRIAGLARGSNARAPKLPGYKWLMFSKDDGATWSEAKTMTCDDGSEIQSSATGCTLFRSIKNDKLYFIGNLCADGKPANGNWPRSPLHIAEVEESTVSIKRDTITIIDQNDGDDTERLQISNFRYYQDRETGDIVIFATRFGENSIKEWKKADHYQYRVAIQG